MNRGHDCIDTIYELTFSSEAEANLKKLAKLINTHINDDDYCFEVCDNGGYVSFIVTHYQDFK